MRKLILGSLLAVAACAGWQPDPDGLTEVERETLAAMALFPTPPADDSNPWLTKSDGGLEKLGQALFFDRRLSARIETSHDSQPNPLKAIEWWPVDDAGMQVHDAGPPVFLGGGVACVDCHAPSAWFSDSRSSPNNVSLGVGWTSRNSPTLVNIAFYRWWAWDGRSDSLWMQAAIAYEAPRTQKGTPVLLARRLLERYSAQYEAVFGKPIDPELATDKYVTDGGWLPPYDAVAANAYQAMAAYMTQLVSASAPFDRFVAGEADALDDSARRGLKIFLGKGGCVECHSGPHFTDNRYHNVGISQRGTNVPASDNGRTAGLGVLLSHRYAGSNPYAAPGSVNRVSGLKADPADLGKFRTKSLRSVSKTAPYMHAGQLATLADVVEFYDRGGDPDGFVGVRDPLIRPLNLTAEEKRDLVSFLEALTGEPVAAQWTCNPRGPSDAGYPLCPGASE